jgi:transcription elongation factor GreA
MHSIPFTRKGYDDLKVKLEEETAKRPNAVLSLKRGRDMGDLSENGLYKAAKQELNDLDRRIRNLKYLIKYGKPIIPTTNEYVQLGHKVTVLKEDGKKEYFIVGENEADPSLNKISLKSPIGHNLMGKRTGEKISINTPSKEIEMTIISIS